MPPSVTIRVGAAHDEVIVDGHTFDRSSLNRHQRQAMTELIVDALFPGRRYNPRPRRSKAATRRRRPSK